MMKKNKLRHVGIFFHSTIKNSFRNKSFLILILALCFFTLLIPIILKSLNNERINIIFSSFNDDLIYLLVFILLSAFCIKISQSLIVNEFIRIKDKELNLIIFTTKTNPLSYLFGKVLAIYLINFLFLFLFTFSLFLGSNDFIFGKLSLNISSFFLLILYIIILDLLFVNITLITSLLDIDEKYSKFDTAFLLFVTFLFSMMKFLTKDYFFLSFVPISNLNLCLTNLLGNIFNNSIIDARIIIVSNLISFFYSFIIIIASSFVITKHKYIL